MDEAKGLLRTCGPDVDIILARDPDQWNNNNIPTSLESSNTSSGMGPVERRRRRKLPPIERPRSAPIHNIGKNIYCIAILTWWVKKFANMCNFGKPHCTVYFFGSDYINAIINLSTF